MQIQKVERGGLPVSFVGLDEIPIMLGNLFAVQQQLDEFILTIAQAAPMASEEDIEQAKPVLVKPLLRVSLSQRRLKELVTLLTAALEGAETVNEEEEKDG